MKTRKKIIAGLCVYILSLLVPILVMGATTSAIDSTVLDGAKYTLTSPSTIQVQLRGLGSEAGPTYTFTDANVSDNDQPGKANYQYTGSFSDGFVCSIINNGGITLNSWPPPNDPTGTATPARISVAFLSSTPGNVITGCSNPTNYVGAVANRSISVVIPATTGGGDTGGGGTTDPSQTVTACETTWSNPLTWIVCPVFDIAAGFANWLLGEFKDQLCFKVDVSPTSTNTSCQVTPLQDVKPVWNAIKNVVSGLLVIIMLIAIFAEATSIGSVDAYTLRRMIPRLVAAVVLIQISFYLFSWVINLVDDLGEGLGSLINSALPGSVDVNSFNQLLGRAGLGNNTVGDQVAWLAVVGVVIAGAAAAIFALPAILMLIFGAVIALLVAWATLIFRKLMIIALLISAPIALLLWILPNTEKYWKTWWDAFLKVLLMFPIIILIIEAGRIFAYIVGPALSQGSPLVALLIVMIAFFGPLFILPKSYKWGGALMQSAGQGITQAGGKVAKPGQEYLQWRQGISRWNTARNMRRGILERQSKTDFARGLSMQGGKGIRGKLRSMQGEVNRARLAGLSTHEGDIRHKATQSAQAEVAKVYEEELGAADAELTQTVLPNFDRSQQDIVREAIALGQTKQVTDLKGRTYNFDGAQHAQNHPMHQRAALNRALIHGQMGVVDQYYTEAIESGDTQRIQEAEFFKQANAQALGEKLPHILKGYGVAANSSEEAISKMHGHEVESIIANFSTKAAAGDTDAADALSGFLQRYQNARNNDNLRGNLDTRGITAVDSFIGAYNGDKSAAATVDDINTGSLKKLKAKSEGKDPNGALVDREGNRSRYRTPGVDPKKAIPLITIPPEGTLDLPETRSSGAGTATGEVQVHPRPVWRQGSTGGTRVSASGLDIPDSSGWTPREDAYGENEARNEYNTLRNRMGSGENLTPDEQRRLQQYRDNHPDW